MYHGSFPITLPPYIYLVSSIDSELRFAIFLHIIFVSIKPLKHPDASYIINVTEKAPPYFLPIFLNRNPIIV